MAGFYYFNVNKDEKGRHEVHIENCSFSPDVSNRKLIGYATDCREAILKAKQQYPTKNFDGCAHCSPDCHRG